MKKLVLIEVSLFYLQNVKITNFSILIDREE